MRILVVQESDWLREGPHQQHQLMDRLSLKSHEVRVVDYEVQWAHSGKRGMFSRRQVFENVHRVLEQASIKLIRPALLKLPVLVYLSLALSHRREINRQITEFRPDVIVGFGILNTYLAVTAAHRKGIPFVYYWIDVLHTLIPFRPGRPLGKLIEMSALRKSDHVIVINEKLKEYVLRIGASAECTSLVGAGIDLRQFDPDVDGGSVRKRYGLHKEDVVLFFMGWLYHFAGLKEVARELARNGNRTLKLLIVGEGDAYGELERIRDAHHLQDKVVLIGKRPYSEVPALVAASDICLLPAYPRERIMQDIVPIKMYEYMAMKKPVIATRLPGVMREFGEDNGVVYVEQPEDVVGKAIELVQNSDVEALGSKARRFVERFDWDTITDEFERILEDVVRGKQGRSTQSVSG